MPVGGVCGVSGKLAVKAVDISPVGRFGWVVGMTMPGDRVIGPSTDLWGLAAVLCRLPVPA